MWGFLEFTPSVVSNRGGGGYLTPTAVNGLFSPKTTSFILTFRIAKNDDDSGVRIVYMRPEEGSVKTTQVRI